MEGSPPLSTGIKSSRGHKQKCVCCLQECAVCRLMAGSLLHYQSRLPYQRIQSDSIRWYHWVESIWECFLSVSVHQACKRCLTMVEMRERYLTKVSSPLRQRLLELSTGHKDCHSSLSCLVSILSVAALLPTTITLLQPSAPVRALNGRGEVTKIEAKGSTLSASHFLILQNYLF